MNLHLDTTATHTLPGALSTQPTDAELHALLPTTVATYGPDDRCDDCGEHFSNPHHPTCPFDGDLPEEVAGQCPLCDAPWHGIATEGQTTITIDCTRCGQTVATDLDW